MKFLQLDLGRGKEAQLLISDQHRWSENSAWYQDASRRAGILVCSPDLSIGDSLETDAGFVWVEVAGVRSHPVNTRRGGKVRSSSWNTKRLSKDKLHEHLEVVGHRAGCEAKTGRSM